MEQSAEIFDLSNRLPTDAEVRSAADAAEAIARACRQNNGQLPFRGENGDDLYLSPALCELITDVLGHVSRGEMVTVIATGASLSTQEAADMLNVSRPFLIKLLTNGEIPFVKVGTHRRIGLQDLMEFKRLRDKAQSTTLDEIAEIGQELDAN